MDIRTVAALSYLRRGWSVVPCHIAVDGGCSCGVDTCSWPGKHPRVSWRMYEKRRATLHEVMQWFERDFYGSNIGIVTGTISDLVVVDIDGGAENFKQLHLPKNTRIVRSGGGGWHLYYKCEEKIGSKIGIVPGIDLKAEGGFIVAPPSVHKSGQLYAPWRRAPLKHIHAGDIPEALMTKPLETGSTAWYAEILKGVSEGERSSATARICGRYAQMGLPIDESWVLMVDWNEKNDPPLKPHELRGTVRAVYRKHQANAPQNVTSVGELFNIFNNAMGRKGG